MTTPGEAPFHKPEQVDHPSAMLGKLLPEVSVLTTVTLLLCAPRFAQWISPEYLMFAAMADGATLMLSATLIDLASRLSRAPPWWLGILIGAGILIAYPDAVAVIEIAWAMSLWVFLPFAWSIVERLRELWTLPSASPLEKIRRRTLTFDRLYTGLIFSALAIASFLLNAIFNDGSAETGFSQRALPWLMLGFYGVAAFNVWRVHRPSFATRPRSLWPKIDGGQATDLGPL